MFLRNRTESEVRGRGRERETDREREIRKRDERKGGKEMSLHYSTKRNSLFIIITYSADRAEKR